MEIIEIGTIDRRDGVGGTIIEVSIPVGQIRTDGRDCDNAMFATTIDETMSARVSAGYQPQIGDTLKMIRVTPGKVQHYLVHIR